MRSTESDLALDLWGEGGGEERNKRILEGRADRRKRKGPQGYDEDNASLDKFCKIKAKKEKHKVDQLQGW